MFGRLLDLLFRRRRRKTHRRDARPSGLSTDWAQTRSPPSQFDLELLPLTEEWLLSLPRHVRPRELATRHLRLTNRLALCWSDAELTERVLDELMLDKRGDRKGFSVPVAAELLALREHHALTRKSPHRAGSSPLRRVASKPD